MKSLFFTQFGFGSFQAFDYSGCQDNVPIDLKGDAFIETEHVSDNCFITISLPIYNKDSWSQTMAQANSNPVLPREAREFFRQDTNGTGIYGALHAPCASFHLILVYEKTGWGR